MRTYVIVTTIVFAFIATVQLARFVLSLQVTVAGVSIPLWASAVAVLFMGALAAWGTRLVMAKGGATATT